MTYVATTAPKKGMKMGFYSSLSFCRPGPPPVIHAAKLLDFVNQFRALGVLRDPRVDSARIKFGEKVDRDDAWIVAVHETSPNIYTVEDIKWDIEVDRPSPKAWNRFVASARRRTQPIYRAMVTLGCASDVITDTFNRKPSEDNSAQLSLWDWHVSIGPEVVSDLNTVSKSPVGWVSISLSGSGYLFPWTVEDVLTRVAKTSELRKVEALCEKFWPKQKGRAGKEIVRARKAMGNLWPYPLGVDFSWRWFVSEGG